MIRTLLGKKFPTSRWALSIGLGSSLVALGAAHGQGTGNPGSATGETQEAERVVVTGSLIPSAAEVGAAPVTTVDQAAVGRAGTDDPQVVLQKSDPSFTGGGNVGTSNASVASGATNGGSQVSLRGLPTLVLLNGRRIADSAAEAAGGLQFQDVNIFPAALIKRIEVLKDGASAIYGSDAVGGVVNVLLNDDFQGVALSGRYGFAQKGDIHDDRESGVAGFGDDKTRIVVAAQYEEQDPILTRQRDFAQVMTNPVLGLTTVSSNFGGKLGIGGGTEYLNTGLANPIVPGQVATNLNSPNQVVAAGSIAPIVVTNADGTTTQVFQATQFPAGTYGASRQIDLNPYTGVTLDQNRTNAYGSFERDIFDKYVTVFGDFLYSKNYSQNFLAPQPVATNSSLNPTQNMTIPFGAPYNPFNSEIGVAQGTVPQQTLADGSTAGNLVVTNRFQAAPRVFRNDTEFYRIVAGVKGTVLKDYNYEVAFNHSEDDISFKNFNLVRADLVDEALAGGYNADGSAAPATFATNAAGQNVVATPAGPYSRINGALYPALDAFALNNPASTERAILGTDIRDQQSKLTVVDAKLTGFPINLPAGPLGFAIGGEYRHEDLRLNDSVENFVASVPVGDVEVGRDIGAGYAEVSIPVISPTMKVPGVYSLDIDGAGRYEKYEGTNSAVTPKVSFVFRPIIDVALRGTYSKSFNAPNLIETNGPVVAGFTNLTNLGAGFQEQASSEAFSNPNLGPVRADTFSAGIVISPHQVPGLTISGDFFHVEQEGIISGGASSTTILQSVNALGAASPYNNQVHFGSFTGPSIAPGTAAGPNGFIAGNASNYFIQTTLNNNNVFREAGVDFTFNYDHDFGPKFGGVTVGLNGTYYFQSKTNETKGGKLFDEVGTYFGDDAGISGGYTPDYKLVPYVEYRYGGASVTALMNYIPSLRDIDFLNDPADRAGNYTSYEHFNLPKIRDYYDIDMTINYEFGLNKATPGAVAPSPKDGKDGKGGGDISKDTSKEIAKKMMAINLLDGLKITFGVNNITNARPPLIALSPDSDNTDTAIYDPFQRYFYFVISKKF